MHVAHVSTFSPTPCGIATYAESLMESLLVGRHSKIRMLYHCDVKSTDALHEIRLENEQAYAHAAAEINCSDVDVVSLQHEFAIFGGRDGEYVLEFLEKLAKPVVTTLHTTRTLMSESQAQIIRFIVARSAAVVVLTEQARDNVAAIVSETSKIAVVRHGVPEVDYKLPKETNLRREWRREHVFFSAGHVSDRKGYTNTLAALRELKKVTADFLYVIVGTHQPQFGSNSQCAYSLKRTVSDFSLQDNVLFVERYVDLDVLLDHIGDVPPAVERCGSS